MINPLNPAQWRLIYDGTVSVKPSIGSWDLGCGSHYWLINNHVEWSLPWTEEQINKGRSRDKAALQKSYKTATEPLPKRSSGGAHRGTQYIKKFLRRR